MDNDIRVVMDKEVYLLVAPAISKSETDIVFRNWLRTGGLTGTDISDGITVNGVSDVLLPMSVTSVESSGRWSLLQGSLQKREFERDQRQYERDYQAFQAEEKKQHAARERGESYTLPPMPRNPSREDYYEYFPENGEYNTSFKGILRAFGEESLGKASSLLYEVTTSLDQLLRHGFPAAEATVSAPSPINRDVLNRLVDEYVSDRGIDWLKDHAKKYEKAKKLEISGVNYRRECNIVFLPARIISYSFAGQNFVAVSDPVRNEYLLGTPPSPVKAALPPAAPKSKLGLMAGAGAAAVLLIGIGVFALMHPGKPAASPSTPSAPASTAAPAQNTQAQQAAQQTAAQQAAEQAAAVKAAQEAAAQQAAAQAAAQQAAQEAAVKEAAEKAAQEAAAKAATQQAEQQAAAEAAEAAKEAAAAQAAQQAQEEAAAKAAKEQAAKEAAAKAAKEVAAKAEAAKEEAAKESRAAELAAAAAAAQAQPAASAPNVTAEPSQPALADTADNLTAAANAAPAAKSGQKEAAANSVPSAPENGLSGTNYEDFSSGKVRLAANGATNSQTAEALSTAATSHDSTALSKAVVQSASGNDLGYYYLGVAAQKQGLYDAARTYYQLSLQHSETDNPPAVCSPGHRKTYQPALCHGIVLPSRAARALASLPGG